MRQAAARMGAVSLFGAELQVRQHQVRMRQHLPRGGKSTRAGGIQRRVVALRPQRLQQRRSEHGLGQRLTARNRNAPRLINVRLTAAHTPQHILHRVFRAARRVPGVRVVAAGTAQRAALQKHHIAQPRSVHRSHGQKRVYAPFHAVFRRLHLCVHGSHRLVERAGDDLALLFFR